MFRFIAASTQNNWSLGADGRVVQRMPAVAHVALFAFSLAYDILGSEFLCVTFLTVVCSGLGVAAQLPRHT